jgi:hypothetical protein
MELLAEVLWLEIPWQDFGRADHRSKDVLRGTMNLGARDERRSKRCISIASRILNTLILPHRKARCSVC